MHFCKLIYTEMSADCHHSDRFPIYNNRFFTPPVHGPHQGHADAALHHWDTTLSCQGQLVSQGGNGAE